MNVTVIVVELLIMFLVIGLLLINPVTFISDYPPEIQEIYYKSQNKEAEKEKLTTMMIIKKVVVLIVFMFLFAWMLHLAGAKTFIQGLLLTYTYVTYLFAWDTFLFLIGSLFATLKNKNNKHNNFLNDHHQKWFHVKVCIPMIPIFAIVGVLSALIMIWIW